MKYRSRFLLARDNPVWPYEGRCVTWWKNPQSLHKAGLGCVFALCFHHTFKRIVITLTVFLRPALSCFRTCKSEGDLGCASGQVSFFPLIVAGN